MTKDRDYLLRTKNPKERDLWIRAITGAQQCEETLFKADNAMKAGKVSNQGEVPMLVSPLLKH